MTGGRRFVALAPSARETFRRSSSWGHSERLADGLDPRLLTMLLRVFDHYLRERSSSSAKTVDALLSADLAPLLLVLQLELGGPVLVCYCQRANRAVVDVGFTPLRAHALDVAVELVGGAPDGPVAGAELVAKGCAPDGSPEFIPPRNSVAPWADSTASPHSLLHPFKELESSLNPA